MTYDISVDELRTLATAAADGEDGYWYLPQYLAAVIDEDDDRMFPADDAAYIAAASPDRILSLLNALDRLRSAVTPPTDT